MPLKLFRAVKTQFDSYAIFVLWPGLLVIVAILFAFGFLVHMVDRLLWG